MDRDELLLLLKRLLDEQTRARQTGGVQQVAPQQGQVQQGVPQVSLAPQGGLQSISFAPTEGIGPGQQVQFQRDLQQLMNFKGPIADAARQGPLTLPMLAGDTPRGIGGAPGQSSIAVGQLGAHTPQTGQERNTQLQNLLAMVRSPGALAEANQEEQELLQQPTQQLPLAPIK